VSAGSRVSGAHSHSDLRLQLGPPTTVANVRDFHTDIVLYFCAFDPLAVLEALGVGVGGLRLGRTTTVEQAPTKYFRWELTVFCLVMGLIVFFFLAKMLREVVFFCFFFFFCGALVESGRIGLDK